LETIARRRAFIIPESFDKNDLVAASLGPGDAEELAQLEAACFADPWDADQFQSAFAGGHFFVHGLRKAGRLISYLSYHAVLDEMEIVNLATLPEFRRKGCAGRLLGRVLHLVENMGIRREYLEVRVTNAPALNLYENFGFVRAGMRKGYYPDTGEDALVMQRAVAEHLVKNQQGEREMGMKFLDQMDIKGKKLLIRVDYNVPLKDGAITDDHRIRAGLPTVKYALDQGASVILCSHLGKPKGKVDPKLSLTPAAARLGELLGKSVTMAPDCVGDAVSKMAAALKPGELLMLENLRFHEEEEKGGADFAKALAALADVYVCDAFGTAHRAHASMVGVTAFSKACCGGFLLKKEWEYLGEAVEKPARPFAAITGGAKVSSKLGVLTNFLDKVDILLIGGAMANTFMAAQGLEVGASLVETDLFEDALKIMKLAKEKNVALHLPVDFVVSMDAGKAISEMKASGTYGCKEIPKGAVILDIGPESVKNYAAALAPAKTVVWNGPMGAFENPDFAAGSIELGKAVAALDAVTIVGGGDTDALVHMAGIAEKISFISTGGGASLEFLEGKELPAFKALKEC